jgi:hypothetical protein
VSSSKLRVESLHILQLDLLRWILDYDFGQGSSVAMQRVCGFQPNSSRILNNTFTQETSRVLTRQSRGVS